MQVNHNKDEFQIMFLSIMGLSGKVVSKVITNPGHYKRIVLAMKENLKKYEDRFGEIKEAEPMGDEIGFKGWYSIKNYELKIKNINEKIILFKKKAISLLWG